jgi:hypothetical protein
MAPKGFPRTPAGSDQIGRTRGRQRRPLDVRRGIDDDELGTAFSGRLDEGWFWHFLPLLPRRAWEIEVNPDLRAMVNFFLPARVAA